MTFEPQVQREKAPCPPSGAPSAGAQNTAPCVRTCGLTVSFFGRTVLRNVSVAFPFGRTSVILGRSGSGKSTLLRSINRLNDCFDGCRESGQVEVALGGKLTPTRGPEAPELTELRRKAGMVFQNPNPLPVSIRKNVTLPLSLAFGLGPGETDRIVREKLALVGLWDEVKDRLDSPALNLSGGQQQRLCLARALALKPELLLLDEPTASLDRTAAARIEDLILSLKGKISVILVSHSLAQASKLSDFAAVIADGEVADTLDAAGLKRSLADGTLLEKAF